MRASRLLNILTTLQASGHVTATRLAEENEVSLRTIYRDIDALSAAGIPVYSERGPEGGYKLLEGYRVRLNGMSSEEAEALAFSGMAGPAAILGLGSILAAAQNKLMVALPESLREGADQMRQRFHLDTSAWHQETEEPLYIREIAAAVWRSTVIRMTYRSWHAEKDRTVCPVGLILKNGAWYAAAMTEDIVKTYRVSRILKLETTSQTFTRPRNFNLVAYWQENEKRLERELHPHQAKLRVSALGLRILKGISPSYVREHMDISPPDAKDYRTVSLPSSRPEQAVHEFLRLGAEIEVLEPSELRQAMAIVARDMAALYEE
ncbi:helix-turn-helix transcriptional regulator [Cohaesibacter intestini]|uniref:helix-turn-helix transcriptional regulator n=1 Tax=Cohaesibacter intestini TaxID=2211145 RepID=UPI000DEB07A5|nr:YafY family protein [Cohaesibacter intestini]